MSQHNSPDCWSDSWKATHLLEAVEPVGGRHRTTSPFAVPIDRSPVTQVLDFHVAASTTASLDDSGAATKFPTFRDELAFDRVAIRIEGANFDYELDATDIAQVFRSLAEVQDVHVYPADPSMAYVDVSAGQGQFIVSLLDGRKLEGIDGYLSAKLVNSDLHDGLLVQLLDPPLPPDPQPPPQVLFHHSGPRSTPCRPTMPSPSLQSSASPAPLSDRQADSDRMECHNLFLDLYAGARSPPGFPLPASPSLSAAAAPTTPYPPPSPDPPSDPRWTPATRKPASTGNRRTDDSTARSTADCRASPTPDESSATHDSRVRKWTSRYEIQIDPHDGFQVTRRIIGTRGAHMKKINASTGAKLRLRGRGSGYLEGSSRQEADDPLHLCISSCDAQKYRMARAMTEKLLQDIYSDYDRWLVENNKPPARLRIKYKELFLPSRPGGDDPSMINGGGESPPLMPTKRKGGKMGKQSSP
eukprot:Blabericola_migrator_1__7146@NODE_361_length_9428_cov_170_189510_g289_i0_p2_GENE_NODE_361_length_9428_cov_170_189510_g289_i0NODE_361_length_9428_cov_170_189510_g289_i0_p2_ORF_typecomplete_len471_score63_73KH_1/PF00013_29/4_5e05_NODE_361_length_9428_cov_170_189510_g289_i076979109